MKVIGIDPSLTATGMAIIDEHDSQVMRIKSAGKRDDSLALRGKRLATIVYEICDLVDHVDPDLVVIEAPAYGAPGGSTHDRSGLWWLLVHTLTAPHASWGREPSLSRPAHRLVEVSPPARVKYGTGKGNAPKDQVLAAVVRRYPLVEVNDNNEADAFLLAAMGMRHLGHPIDDLPATHVAAMDKVRWLD